MSDKTTDDYVDDEDIVAEEPDDMDADESVEVVPDGKLRSDGGDDGGS
jgi:hypothetical protein